MASTASAETLTADQLNRATLARQLLLERSPLTLLDALQQIVALQGQEPASPYVGLWTRVAGFRRTDVDAAFARRTIVRGTVMRMTLHVVTASDYPMLWSAHEPSFRRSRALALRLDQLGFSADRVDKIIADATDFAVVPRSNQDLINYLTERHGPLSDRDWWWVIRGMSPFLYAVADDPATARWSFARRPTHVAASAWLPGQVIESGGTADDALDRLVERYLRGFGPAGVLDVAQFTRLDRARIRAALERLRPTLRSFHDEQGRELFDVPDGELPDADVPAPVRFLPMWDSVLLAYADRSRLMPDEHRRTIIRTNGDVLPTFLVDGRVAGLWRATLGDNGPKIDILPFGRLSRAVRTELAAEAESLAALIAPVEPEVYRRYGRWWPQ